MNGAIIGTLGECPCRQIPYSPYAKKRKTKLSILIRKQCFCGRFSE